MTIADRWLLPDGVDEVLPPAAGGLERIRRRLLDVFAGWGYEYVIPPMIEFLESLLTGTGHDLDLQTFKLTDRISGRLMGIRADMTAQVARIDAHSLNRDGVVRLCYAGTVLHAMADHMLASRTPIRVGAELYGESGNRSDVEIVSLMLQSLEDLGQAVHLELGDVGIFRDLMVLAEISSEDEEVLFEMTQRKSVADLTETMTGMNLSGEAIALITGLPGLSGGLGVLGRAADFFAGHPGIISRLQNLSELTEVIRSRYPDVQIHCDLSELRGYAYHTGIVFAAYTDTGRLVAKGGRYDHIGEVFGRSRGATGFDLDLKALGELVTLEDTVPRVVRVEDSDEDPAGRWRAICSCREKGYVVVESGGDQADNYLGFHDGEWKLMDGKPG